MSRARDFIDPITNETVWFDIESRARTDQLELLADWENIELDDLLDEGLSQKQVLWRLRQVATPEVIPPHIVRRRREREQIRGKQLACRICTLDNWECEGHISRHHFVPRWLMMTLENYPRYALRSLCTIPICTGTHRDLHRRTDDDKSIVNYLRHAERMFAHKMLRELEREHPIIFDLISEGDFHSYEYQLVRDFIDGRFLKEAGSYTLPEYV